MASEHFDVVVIGTGSGSKITRPAANLGYKVAVIDKGKLGGTCLNHGCIPSKMLIHPADIVCEAEEGKKHGIVFSEPSVDFESLVRRVTKTIDDESDSIKPIYDAHKNITLFEGHARFESNLHKKVIHVELRSGEVKKITGDKVFICTGAMPSIPKVKGLSETPFWTYKDALRAEKQPKSLTIVGGGYIAVELGHFFKSLGTKVTFLVRSEFLRPEDADIKSAFHKAFSPRFNTYFGVNLEKVQHNGREFEISFSSKVTESKNVKNTEAERRTETITSEQLLIATGVKPATENLGIENTNITLDAQGHINVDQYLKTEEPGVWAMGDVVGKYKFRHSANFEGEYVFKTVFGHESGKDVPPIMYPPMPHAVFTYPQVAGVGVKEDDCDPEAIIVGKNNYEDSAMGMALLPDVGVVKLIFAKKTRHLIGAHIVGKEAATMIHMAIAYINMGATIDDLMNTIYIHPALPENIRNAARKANHLFERNET